MVLHAARGPRAAHPGTRVATLVVDARAVGRAVGVDGALRFALDVRVALEAGKAGARGAAADLTATLGIDAARRWVARVRGRQGCS